VALIVMGGASAQCEEEISWARPISDGLTEVMHHDGGTIAAYRAMIESLDQYRHGSRSATDARAAEKGVLQEVITLPLSER
jgi:hypothetical protein